MKYLSVLLITLGFLGGCVAPPSSPMEAAARKAVGAELVAKRCAGYAGGYEGVQKLRQDSNKNIALARSLGATDAVIAKARVDVDTGFNTQVAFTDLQSACNTMVGELAWAVNG